MAKDLAARARKASEQRATDTAPPTEGDQKPSVEGVAAYLSSLTGEIKRALPAHMNPDRMARVALTVVRKTPKLAECTQPSFAGALLTAAALGLEPGVNEECYLVPYTVRDRNSRRVLGMECQLIIGYQGYIKQFFQSPLASMLDAHAVHANDDFDFEYGTQPFLRHKPARGDRGPITDYYAVAKLTTGAPHFEVLTVDEVRELRGGRVGPNGDIPDPQHWMERKTALRQVLKLLPKSVGLAALNAADERDGTDLYRERLEEAVIDVEPVGPALASEPEAVGPDASDQTQAVQA